MKLSLFATNIERRKAVNVWINPTKQSDIKKRKRIMKRIEIKDEDYDTIMQKSYE